MSDAGETLTQVVWSKSALSHLQSIRAYIQQFNPRAANEVGRALYEAGNSLAAFPHRGRAVAGTELRELVSIYPYVIRYRITRDAIRILRVRHTARRPTAP